MHKKMKMRKIIKQLAIIPSLAVAFALNATTFDITDLLPKKDTTSNTSDVGSKLGKLGNVLGNLLGKSDLSISDLSGVWKATGPAVSLKSDNVLAKVGGAAAATAAEDKVRAYYDKLGLEDAVVTFYPDSTFSLKNKKINLKGTISSPESGKYMLNFSAAGLFNIGSAETYLEKSGNTLKLLFDMTTLKNLATGLAKISGSGLASTAAGLLDNYDGMYMGITLKKTSNVEAGASAFSKKISTQKNTDNVSTSKSKKVSKKIINQATKVNK